MFIYKIRNKKTGKFIANDSWSSSARETDEGTIFSSKQSLGGHLSYRRNRYFKKLGNILLPAKKYEIVKFELKEVGSFLLKNPSVKGI